MYRHLHRAFGGVQSRGHLRVSHRPTHFGQRGFQLLEQFLFAIADVIRAQPPENLIEQRERPAPLENFLRGQIVGGLKAKGSFGGRRINRNQNLSAAALLRLRLVPFVREKMFQRREQERTEAALRAIHLGEIIFRQQPREKFLRQILRVVRVVALPPHERINRRPVRAAKFLQRNTGMGRIIAPCRHDDTPMRGGEISCRRKRILRVLGGGHAKS